MTLTPAKRRLLIIDGMCVIRRTYEGVPIADPKAKADGAMRACAASILKVIHQHRPTHFVLAMDTPGKNWRHNLYPAYKAHREPAPQELMDAVPQLTSQLESYGLRAVAAPGYEGDDVVNTIALKSLEAGFEVIVDSTDKDFFKLLSRGAKIWDHFNKAWRDESYCIEKYGVPSSKMTDFLALAGDEDDGIPGVTKVGAKTAASLLREHGSLEGVLQAAQLIKGKVGEHVREEADIARMSYRLAEMSDSTPLALNAADLRVPATLPSPADAFNGLLVKRPAQTSPHVESSLMRTPSTESDEDWGLHPETIILITCLDDSPNAMRGSLVISHGIHARSGKTVVLSCDSVETYLKHGARYSKRYGEYVLDGAKLVEAVRYGEARDKARGPAAVSPPSPRSAVPATGVSAQVQGTGTRSLMRRMTSSSKGSDQPTASSSSAPADVATSSASPSSTSRAEPTRKTPSPGF